MKRSNELLKERHNVKPQRKRNFYIGYTKGDVVDKILNRLMVLTGSTRTEIVRSSIFAYYNFMMVNLKHIENSEKDENEEKNK